MEHTEFDDITLSEPLEYGLICGRIGYNSVTDFGKVTTNVPHLVTHHSPSGFEFGYEGSGPADLALNLCEVVLNRLGYTGERMTCFDGDCWTLAYQIHQECKRKFIAPLPREGGTVPYVQIETWIDACIIAHMADEA